MPLSAQQPLTIDELRDGYIRQYVRQEKLYDLSKNDVVAYRLTGQPVPPQGAGALSFDFMEGCTTLRNAGKIMLPPSKYIVTFDSYSKKENLRIYWMGLRDSTREGDERQLSALLKKHYGVVRLGDVIEAVPALWVRGDVHTLHALYEYGGFVMSDTRSFCIHMPEKGKENLGYASDETLDKGQIVKDFSDLLYRGRRGDKVFVSRKQNHAPDVIFSGAIRLLARDVNVLLPKNAAKTTNTKCYPLQLVTNEGGKLMALPVRPENLTDEDKSRLETLNVALEKIPSGTLWTACTIDGRPYSCANIEATYMGENGRWWFEECTRVCVKK